MHIVYLGSDSHRREHERNLIGQNDAELTEAPGLRNSVDGEDTRVEKWACLARTCAYGEGLLSALLLGFS